MQQAAQRAASEPEGTQQSLTINLSKSQFEKLLELLSEKPKGKWRDWVKLILVAVLVTALGAWAAQRIAEHFSQHPDTLAQAQAVEKFIPYFDIKHSHQQRYLALQSLIQIGNYDAAADLIATLPHNYQGAKEVLNPNLKREEAKSDAETTAETTDDQRVRTKESSEDDVMCTNALALLLDAGSAASLLRRGAGQGRGSATQ